MQQEPRCFFCGEMITDDNKSDEHIIPNSIGGRKKVGNFICRKCNNELGTQWDKKFTDEFSFLTNLLNIKKERGKVLSVKYNGSDGQIYLRSPDNRFKLLQPIAIDDSDNEKVKLAIKAPTRKKLLEVLEKYKNKYPEICSLDLDNKIQNTPNTNISFSKEIIPINLADCSKTIIKSCLALAYANNLKFDDTLCKNFYNNKIQFSDIIYPINFKNKTSKMCNHILYLQANKETNNIVCYFSIFNIYNYIILLSKNYTGQNINASYSIDPIKGKEISINRFFLPDLKVLLNLSARCLLKETNFEGYISCINETFLPAKKTYEDLKKINISLDSLLENVLFNEIMECYKETKEDE